MPCLRSNTLFDISLTGHCVRERAVWMLARTPNLRWIFVSKSWRADWHLARSVYLFGKTPSHPISLQLTYSIPVRSIVPSNYQTGGTEELFLLRYTLVCGRMHGCYIRSSWISYPTDVLDGAMIVLAIYTMNFAHPGVLLRISQTRGSQDSLELKQATSV